MLGKADTVIVQRRMLRMSPMAGKTAMSTVLNKDLLRGVSLLFWTISPYSQSLHTQIDQRIHIQYLYAALTWVDGTLTKRAHVRSVLLSIFARFITISRVLTASIVTETLVSALIPEVDRFDKTLWFARNFTNIKGLRVVYCP